MNKSELVTVEVVAAVVADKCNRPQLVSKIPILFSPVPYLWLPAEYTPGTWPRLVLFAGIPFVRTSSCLQWVKGTKTTLK